MCVCVHAIIAAALVREAQSSSILGFCCLSNDNKIAFHRMKLHLEAGAIFGPEMEVAAARPNILFHLDFF